MQPCFVSAIQRFQWVWLCARRYNPSWHRANQIIEQSDQGIPSIYLHHMCVYIYMHSTSIYVYIHVHTQTHTPTHPPTHPHAHTHTVYIHIHTQPPRCSPHKLARPHSWHAAKSCYLQVGTHDSQRCRHGQDQGCVEPKVLREGNRCVAQEVSHQTSFRIWECSNGLDGAYLRSGKYIYIDIYIHNITLHYINYITLITLHYISFTYHTIP